MENITLRRAAPEDAQAINRLLYQVHAVHSAARPDIFKAGAKKYTDSELLEIIGDEGRPIFVAERQGQILGYAFCIHQQYLNSNSMTDIETLYIDDLCVDKDARGAHVGSALYEFVLDYARQQGYYNVTLNVWADNTGAVKFYEKLGLRVQKIGMEKIL